MRQTQLTGKWRKAIEVSEFGSCVLKAFAVKCQSMPLIDTQSTLQHSIDITMNTRWTLDRHSINSWLIVGNQLIFIKRHPMVCA